MNRLIWTGAVLLISALFLSSCAPVPGGTAPAVSDGSDQTAREQDNTSAASCACTQAAPLPEHRHERTLRLSGDST